MELKARPGQQAQCPDAGPSDLLERGFSTGRWSRSIGDKRPRTSLEPQPRLNPRAQVLEGPLGKAPIPKFL
eukprot:1520968-Alexandrium_andersonii.AAC.1